MSYNRRIGRSQRQARQDTSPGVEARTTIIRVERGAASTSRQLDLVDDWSVATSINGLYLSPPYDPYSLFARIEQSSILPACIAAYTTNTVGTGWEVDPLIRGAKKKDGEAMELQSFIDNSNADESLMAVMSKVINDRESVGYGFLEGIRDISGRLSLLRHAPAIITRLGVKIEQEVQVAYQIQRGRRVVEVREFRKFRKFLQLVAGKVVWFKEWGDPREMNRDTGAVKGIDNTFVAGSPATEILHFKLPSNEPYGVPRWISQLPSVIGSREAEEVNMRYFEDNTVPPMMLTVSGGRLTAHSYKELTRALQQANVGKDRQNRIMLIEATSDSDSLDKAGTPVRLNVEKLTDARQSDSLFSEYDTANQNKIRMAWRFPGIVLGAGADLNYANAQAALQTVEQQVFSPGRCEIDEILNKKVVNSGVGMDMSSVKLVSRTPSISSPETLIKTLTALNVMGAVTPRSAMELANKVLQLELPSYPLPGEEGYEAWMDQPMIITTRNTKTHNEQAQKTDGIKDLEENGTVGFTRPENGSENPGADE